MTEFATGGIVHGPGSGTSDSIDVHVSGCLPMSAAQVAKLNTPGYRRMLELMKSGEPFPRFASGGLIQQAD